MKKNGFLLTILIDDDLFLIEIFRFFRIGISWRNDEIGNAKALIFGIWRLESNFTIAYRKEMSWHDYGKA
tara:strand:+ start:101 stop:310 length:210 start_codon:yes stop_codon:yes gene_type:complete